MDLIATLSINNTQQNDTQHQNRMSLYWVSRFSYCCAEHHYAECQYAKCCYDEFHYAECQYAECCYAECHYAVCRGA
jgi:hypothetical protein